MKKLLFLIILLISVLLIKAENVGILLIDGTGSVNKKNSVSKIKIFKQVKEIKTNYKIDTLLIFYYGAKENSLNFFNYFHIDSSRCDFSNTYTNPIIEFILKQKDKYLKNINSIDTFFVFTYTDRNENLFWFVGSGKNPKKIEKWKTFQDSVIKYEKEVLKKFNAEVLDINVVDSFSRNLKVYEPIYRITTIFTYKKPISSDSIFISSITLTKVLWKEKNYNGKLTIKLLAKNLELISVKIKFADKDLKPKFLNDSLIETIITDENKGTKKLELIITLKDRTNPLFTFTIRKVILITNENYIDDPKIKHLIVKISAVIIFIVSVIFSIILFFKNRQLNRENTTIKELQIEIEQLEYENKQLKKDNVKLNNKIKELEKEIK